MCIHDSSFVIHFQIPRLAVVEVRLSSRTISDLDQSSWHLRNSWNKSWIFLAEDTGSWSAMASINFFLTGGGQLGPRTFRENRMYWAFLAFLSSGCSSSGVGAGSPARSGFKGVAGTTAGGCGGTTAEGCGGTTAEGCGGSVGATGGATGGTTAGTTGWTGFQQR